jgi:hypothetical protein
MFKQDFLPENVIKIIKYILMLFIIFLSCHLILSSENNNNNNFNFFIIALIGGTTFIIFDQISPSIKVTLTN